MTASQHSSWPAPSASAPVTATVTVPGSKSVTNRALVLAALADGPGRLRRPLRSRDSALMAGGLRALGVGIEEAAGPDGAEEWRVAPGGGLRGDASVDVGNAGTVMRFLPPVATLADGPVRFDGDPRSHERPLHGVIDALRALGARIDDAAEGSPGALPLTVHGGGALRGGPVEVDASSSSQFVSALLLSAPRFDKGVELRHTGHRLPSMPHIRMTVEMLRAAGAEVEAPEDGGEPNVWRVAPGPLRGREVTVEPDLSNAQPFLAAALVTGGRVTIRDWPRVTTQPGDALREIFTAMGGSCELVTTAGGTDLVFTGPAGGAAEGGVHGIDIDLSEVGELTPGIAAVAALAGSPSRLRGVGHLRLHETDRLAALTAEINGLGGDVTETEDGLAIRPRPLHGGVFHTYDDHRMATAGAVLGLVVADVGVENVATTAKTLPDFPGMWAGLLAGTDTGAAAGSAGAGSAGAGSAGAGSSGAGSSSPGASAGPARRA